MNVNWRKLWDNLLVSLGALTLFGVICELLWFTVLDLINWIRN
jgi:hypothetical protein